MTDNSEAIFRLLKVARSAEAEFRVRDTGLDIANKPVQHALDARGMSALLVPMGPDEAELEDTQSRAISLRSFPIEGVKYLVVRCEEARLEPQFALIVDDMLSALREAPSKPAAACLAVLERWRALLERSSDGLLSVQAQIGLLAELHVLELLTSKERGLGLERWLGPDRSRHDFSGPDVAVEVKATLGREHFNVAIHGDRQLEEPEHGQLLLYAEQFERSNFGDSLSDLVERVLALGVDRLAFLQKLASVGYRLEDGAAYHQYRFAVLRRRLCHVDDSFPRIGRLQMKNPSILDKIHELAYSVDIAPLTAACADELALDHLAGLLESK